MNVPNKLTVLRLILVPVFFIGYQIRSLGFASASIISTIIMVVCYAIAELSDLLDGKIARKYNLVTDLGKVLDPFADTLSHLTFFVCFFGYGIMPAWVFIIIMWREFGILFLRMLMMKTGKAMPANIFGKSKTVFYAITTFLAILFVTLVMLTALRYYSDVGFRMKGDFVRYLLFYVSISIGYLLGILVYNASGEWMAAIILGESRGILFVVIFGTIYKKKVLTPSKNLPLVIKSMSFLSSRMELLPGTMEHKP